MGTPQYKRRFLLKMSKKRRLYCNTFALICIYRYCVMCKKDARKLTVYILRNKTSYCLITGEHNLELISKLNCTTGLFYPPKKEQDNVFTGIEWFLANCKSIKSAKKTRMTALLLSFRLIKSEPKVLDSLSMSLSFAVITKRRKKRDSSSCFLPF
jgi:hypothetical protein